MFRFSTMNKKMVNNEEIVKEISMWREHITVKDSRHHITAEVNSTWKNIVEVLSLPFMFTNTHIGTVNVL